MIGLYVLRDKKLIELAEKYFKKDLSERLMLYDDIDQENLKNLYETCRKIKANYRKFCRKPRPFRAGMNAMIENENRL
ncbi:hypothetical protein [Anaerocellum diazotrophicum]|uniref:Uncharacterized protein n=1 Tax=Caldicellulosiruptor diazotrophicus TaxID=2806205 RepID=A0ABN6EAM9_9FIRM|nr:hypothetical protein [Caldicellulosiruptor diazotrophicus]BCS82424.1 hypothetical protein CaldiYA01_23840 [Caldicellulosiruptor diazotrophicus]